MEKEINFRKRVYSFYEKNFHQGHTFTIEHFKKEGKHAKTVRRILNRYDNGIPAERQGLKGSVAKKMTDEKIHQLIELFDHSDWLSQVEVAKDFGIDQSYVSKILKNKTKIKRYKKTKIPARTEEQKILAKSKSGKLCRKYINVDLFIDDESYFGLSNSKIGNNNYYYSSDKNKTSQSVKYNSVAKYEEKR